MYGYIYKTTNLVNGKIYVGKKKGEFTENYKGSGKYLKNAINKYGIENFKVEVIEYCETLDIQNKREKYWINYYRNENVEMYNIANGGDGGDIFSCLPKEQLQEIKDYISYCSKNGICGNKGKHLSEEHKRKISQANKGRKLTSEHIEKDRQAHLGKKAWNKGKHTGSLSYEHKEHIRKDHLGRLWINNGNINKWIKPCELENYLGQGFRKGRLKCPNKV